MTVLTPTATQQGWPVSTQLAARWFPGRKVMNGRAALSLLSRAIASGTGGHKITVLKTHVVGNAGYSVANFLVSVPVVEHPSDRRVEQGHIVAIHIHDSVGWHPALV